ncbi:MAG: type II toxin-antitoxin system RelE/ParE family toxin [Comamonadaceae bacterium]|nr:type II toxin-antitoxin system RelE/ParE family toxin [Comamonadaceae bacterium]
MASVGPGVQEIRVRDAAGACRVIYMAKFADAIYILHYFDKRPSARQRRTSIWATAWPSPTTAKRRSYCANGRPKPNASSTLNSPATADASQPGNSGEMRPEMCGMQDKSADLAELCARGRGACGGGTSCS